MSRHQFGKKLEEKVFQTVYPKALRQERVHAFEGKGVVSMWVEWVREG